VPATAADTSGDTEAQPPSATGYYLIAVPRSPLAPHAVVDNDRLRYPRRNGATTRYLTEAEVAAAYADRLASINAQALRSQEVERFAINDLDRQAHAWVLVSLVPDHPGDVDINFAALQKFETEVQGKLGLGGLTSEHVLHFRRTSVRYRRLIADGGERSPLAEKIYASFHSDGSGAFAVQLRDLLGPEQRQMLRQSPWLTFLVSDEYIALSVIAGLLNLADHAVNRAATGGNALLRARIVSGGGAAHTPTIGHTRGSSGARVLGSINTDQIEDAAETSAPLDELPAPGQALMATAARLCHELGQAFGAPELPQLTRDGQIRLSAWSGQTKADISSWADENDVPTVG